MAKTDLERKLEDLNRLRAKGVVTDDEYESRRTAILAHTDSPATAKGGRGGGIFKWGMLGCLGIFGAIGLGVVVLIVIIAAAVGSSTTDDTADSGGDVRAALAEGTSAVISPDGNGNKQSKVTILQIKDGVTSSNQFSQPTEGKKYYALEVAIENVGTAEVSSLDWKIRDSTDTESDRTFVSGIGENLEVFYNLTPGGKQQGWVVFEIAASATPKWIRADPNSFLKDDLYFDAQ